MKRQKGENESIEKNTREVSFERSERSLKTKTSKKSSKSRMFCSQFKGLLYKSISLQKKQVATNIFQFFACFIVIGLIFISKREMLKLFTEEYNFDQVNTIPMFMNLPSGFFQQSKAYPINKTDCFVYYQFKDKTRATENDFSPNDLLSPLFKEYCPRKKLYVPYIQEVDGARKSNDIVVERMSRMESEYPMKFGRERGGLDQLPDVLVDFDQISRKRLAFLIQINDSLYIEYHRNNGFTKTLFKIPEKSLMDKFKEMFEKKDVVKHLLDNDGRIKKLRDARDSIGQLKNLRFKKAFEFGKKKFQDHMEERKRKLKEGEGQEKEEINFAGFFEEFLNVLKDDNPEVNVDTLTAQNLIDKDYLKDILGDFIDLDDPTEINKKIVDKIENVYSNFSANKIPEMQKTPKLEETPEKKEKSEKEDSPENIDARILEASPFDHSRPIRELLTDEETLETATEIIENPEKIKQSIIEKLKSKSTSFPQINPTEGIILAEDFLLKNFIRQIQPKLSIVSAMSYIENVGTKDSIFRAIFATISIMLLPLGLIGHFSVFLYHFKLEKHQKTRHLMILHGLSPMTYWVVGYLFSFLLSLVSGLIFVVSVRVFLDLPVFSHSSPFLIFILYCLWSHSQVSMAILFQNSSLSPQMASIFAYILSVFNLMGSTYVNSNIFLNPVQPPVYLRVFLELSFTRIMQDFSVACLHDRCYQSFSEMPWVVHQNFLYLFGLSTLYLVLGIAIDLGICSSVFWCCSKPKRESVDASGNLEISDKKTFAINQEVRVEEDNCLLHLESAPGQSAPLLISKVSKTFSTFLGKLKAVNNVSFQIPTNSIFGLLGPNGAGKTTLMKMITSMQSPDSGEILIDGLNIKGPKNQVHQILGVCPQFDCLYPEMTIEEHFLLFIRLRGISGKRENEVLLRTLKQMGLEEHSKKRVSQLSGGMKRRVSIGIALCGDTKLVLLDEPTSGLDPVNRQQIWEIVKKLKASRAILLTTHLMDEAEALCDKLGIIVKGQLITLGNQGFLKAKYARGIHLKVKFTKTQDSKK